MPVGPLGISSTMTMRRGTLKGARRSDANRRSSFSVTPGSAQDDRSRDILAQVGIGQRKGHGLGHRRVVEQNLIDLARRDLFSAAVDDLLEPARDDTDTARRPCSPDRRCGTSPW